MVKRALPFVVLALALAGCGKQDRGAVASPAEVTESAPTAFSPSPTDEPTLPPEPVCVSAKGWTNADIGKWAQDLIQTDVPNKITFTPNYLVDELCQAVKIQVEFWRVDFQTITETTYEMTSVLRKRVSLDGKKTVTVAAPKGFSRGTCRGTVLAAYAGEPMSSDGLPDSLSANGYSGKSQIFLKGDRVFYTFSSMPKISGSLFGKTGCEPKITLVPKKK